MTDIRASDFSTAQWSVSVSATIGAGNDLYEIQAVALDWDEEDDIRKFFDDLRGYFEEGLFLEHRLAPVNELNTIIGSLVEATLNPEQLKPSDEDVLATLSQAILDFPIPTLGSPPSEWLPLLQHVSGPAVATISMGPL